MGREKLEGEKDGTCCVLAQNPMMMMGSSAVSKQHKGEEEDRMDPGSVGAEGRERKEIMKK